MQQFVVEELAGFLKQSSVFAILDDDSIHRLAERATMQRFSLGETIIEEGDDGCFAWLIFSGRVRVLKRSDSGHQITLGTQSVGELFGEQAILTDSSRSASVRATEDVVLFRIERADFLELLDQSENLRQYFDQFMHERAVRDFLRTQTFLGKLRAKDVTALLDQLEPRDFAAGETVLQEGAVAECLYIVREGRLKAVRHVAGREQILGYLSDGDFFGELALLTDAPRSASVIAESAARCFALSRQNFDRLLSTAPAIREQLTERFSRYDAANELLAFSGKRSTFESISQEQKPATQTTGDSQQSLKTAPLGRPTVPDEAAMSTRSTGRRLQKLRTGPRWFELLPWIPQQDESDCGAASLAMVARYFGIRIPVERLRRLAQTGYAGVSLYSLSAAASQIGFRPRAIRTTLDRLTNIPLPAIVHWQNRHYLVLYQHDENTGEFVVGDPERGLIKLTRPQFENGWTGMLLLLEPTARLEEHSRPDSALKRLLRLLQSRMPGRLRERSDEQLHPGILESSDRTASMASSVRLENVSFRFSPDGPDVLSGINLEVLPGQTVAIVGRTGSGKSLLAALLQGTVSPIAGRRSVDGKSLSADGRVRQENCSLPLMDCDLFDGLTIAENIAMGSNADPVTDRELIITAAEQAEADSFIKRLPYGYDTPIGSGFALLSTGEKQLLTLARAALMDVTLLVMDETLSALPSEMARRVLLRLRQPLMLSEAGGQVRRRAIVVTSRNVAAVRDADLIAVLDNGHLVETGNHQELMARDGLYSFLWRERSA